VSIKPLLLGMNNPLSDDPHFDLYPYPRGCAGYRLWQMLPEGTTRSQYLDAFERRNLLRAREWSSRMAREAADGILPQLVGRLVVVLGRDVRSALGLSPAEPLSINEEHVIGGGPGFDLRWLAFPHPSGRNRWFNDPENYLEACRVLTKVFLGAYV